MISERYTDQVRSLHVPSPETAPHSLKRILSGIGSRGDVIVEAINLDRRHFTLSPIEEDVLVTAALLDDMRNHSYSSEQDTYRDKNMYGLMSTQSELAYIYANLCAGQKSKGHAPLIPDELTYLDWNRLFSTHTIYTYLSRVFTSTERFPFPKPTGGFNTLPQGVTTAQLKETRLHDLIRMVNGGARVPQELVDFVCAKDTLLGAPYLSLSHYNQRYIPSVSAMLENPDFRHMRASVAVLTNTTNPPLWPGTYLKTYVEVGPSLYPVYEQWPHQEVEDAVVDGSVSPTYYAYRNGQRYEGETVWSVSAALQRK